MQASDITAEQGSVLRSVPEAQTPMGEMQVRGHSVGAWIRDLLLFAEVVFAQYLTTRKETGCAALKSASELAWVHRLCERVLFAFDSAQRQQYRALIKQMKQLSAPCIDPAVDYAPKALDCDLSTRVATTEERNTLWEVVNELMRGAGVDDRSADKFADCSEVDLEARCAQVEATVAIAIAVARAEQI